MADTRRSKYNEHFDVMDGCYVCRICGDVFPDGSRSNRSTKMKAHLTEAHPELVLKWWPRTPEEIRTFLVPDFAALRDLIIKMETVENELEAKEKVLEVFRMGRQLDRLIKRYEDRILTNLIEFPEEDSSQLKTEECEELLNSVGNVQPEIEADKMKNFKKMLPKLAEKYSDYYRMALHCSEILLARFKEPCLFSSQDIAHKTFNRTKKDVNNHICIATKGFGISATRKSSSSH